MRISDWSSDVCSSDLREAAEAVDDVEMFLRIILEHRVVEPAEQPQRFALIAAVLAVLEGQAGELAPLVGPGLVPAACHDAARDISDGRRVGQEWGGTWRSLGVPDPENKKKKT